MLFLRSFVWSFFMLCSSAVLGQVVVNEFVAENATSATDEDGANPDWIELLNTTADAVNLEGWHLSDAAAQPLKWRIPAIVIPGRGYLIVFASGKDRANPAGKLHANFQFNNAGGSLWLRRPDGSVASQFLNYPAQREDVGYGTEQKILPGNLVQQGSPVKSFVPSNGTLNATWTQPVFTETGWTSGAAGVGYDTSPASPGLLVFYNFNAAMSSVLDNTGNGRLGIVEGGAAFTALGAGRTGGSGDRAMSFTNTNFNRVRIAAAETGGLDSITVNDAVTVSAWINGDSTQPQPDGLFYGDETTTGVGTRVLNAHVPWLDSVVYWDCGGFNAGQRLSVPLADSSKWKGVWNHYVFTKGNGKLQIWLNGTMIASDNSAPGIGTLRSFFLGYAPWGPYGGLVDDLAIWNRALSPEEIVAIANGGSPLNPFAFTPLIGRNVQSVMHNIRGSVFTRFAFTFTGVPDFDALRLRMKYDDGFVAYLNGTEIARRGAPATLQWNSLATVDRARADALAWLPLEIPGGAAQLTQGSNVLAIHGLNDSLASTEMLSLPELAKSRTAPNRYLIPATAETANSTGVGGFVADTIFDVKRGWFTSAFNTTVTCATPGATIIITTDGSAPTLLNGSQHPAQDANTPPAATLSISGTTTLRAAAFKPDLQPTNVDTQTYLFAAQVANQSDTQPGWPTTWPAPVGSLYPGDYAMDPDVTTTTQPGYSIEDSLLSIPTLSIVGKLSDIVTLYGSSAFTGSLQAPELTPVATSVEWIDPATPTSNWQEDCAFNIHGNISRAKWFTPKHGFSLNFSADYGARTLDQNIFPGTGVTKFDRLVLKSLSTDTWPCSDAANSVIDGDTRWKREQSTYLHDEFFRRTHLTVSGTSARGRYVHLFINGVYWGLNNVIEHLDNKFAAEHFGGARDEWDVIKDYNELADGERTSWDQLLTMAGSTNFGDEAAYQQAQGNQPDGTRNPAYPVLLDVPNLIDYMIVHISQGADDWPDKNWYGMRRRTDPNTGFKFLSWDQEISNNSILKQHSANGPLYELVDQAGRPAQIYTSARANAGFRRQFGDRVQALFFNDGAMTETAMAQRWHGLQASIDQAVVAESARWGDYQRAVPFKREVEWLAANDWMDTTYWPQFVSRALIRFRNAGIFPNTEAPSFSQHGGTFANDFLLTLNDVNGAGPIYYTLDGSDPATAGALIYTTPVPLNGLVTVRSRVQNGMTGEWSAMTAAAFQPEQDFTPLVVTEIHFAPAGSGSIGGKEFEFIEMQNTGAVTLDLSTCAFNFGIRYTFPPGSLLLPGALVVIARNPIRFTARFGGTPHGPYDGKLDNSGEGLTFVSALGTQIFSFRYETSPPWPSAVTNSLHYLSGLPNNLTSWFAGAPSPGIHPADADGDGASNARETIAGTNPGDPNSVLRIIELQRQPDASILGSFDAVEGYSYRVFVSPNLTDWIPLCPDLTAPVTGPLNFTDQAPVGPRLFYKVETPPRP